MKRFLAGACWLLLLSGVAAAQITGDVIGMHDMTPGSGSPIQGPRPGSCTYCHVPHSGNGNMVPLWNQKLSTATYTPYSSTTDLNKGMPQMPLGSDSGLCLSCHDGTVAVGDTVLFGQYADEGKLEPGRQLRHQPAEFASLQPGEAAARQH